MTSLGSALSANPEPLTTHAAHDHAPHIVDTRTTYAAHNHAPHAVDTRTGRACTQQEEPTLGGKALSFWISLDGNEPGERDGGGQSLHLDLNHTPVCVV